MLDNENKEKMSHRSKCNGIFISIHIQIFVKLGLFVQQLKNIYFIHCQPDAHQ